MTVIGQVNKQTPHLPRRLPWNQYTTEPQRRQQKTVSVLLVIFNQRSVKEYLSLKIPTEEAPVSNQSLSSRLWTAAWISSDSVTPSQNAKEKIGKL